MKGFQQKTAYLTQNVCYVSLVGSTGRFTAVLCERFSLYIKVTHKNE